MTVSSWANWIAPTDLASVGEGHHVRIGDKGCLMFVLNLGRSPLEHEAVILGKAGVSKGRIVRSGNGGTHSPHVSFEEHPPFPSYTRSVTSPQDLAGERYGTWLLGEFVAPFQTVIKLHGL